MSVLRTRYKATIRCQCSEQDTKLPSDVSAQNKTQSSQQMLLYSHTLLPACLGRVVASSISLLPASGLQHTTLFWVEGMSGSQTKSRECGTMEAEHKQDEYTATMTSVDIIHLVTTGWVKVWLKSISQKNTSIRGRSCANRFGVGQESL